MKEEDHFTRALLPALSHCCTWQQGCCLWQPFFLSCSLHILHSLLKICCSLSVPIYRQEWCLQLQLFFNNGGCQSQWLVSSICCTLMATNPTISSEPPQFFFIYILYFLLRLFLLNLLFFI
jgi:hypothetical protein